MTDKSVINTIIAEAGGDPKAQAAVAHVILNRMAQTGQTAEQVVKASGQFAGYSNPGPKSVQAQNDAKVVATAQQVWDGVQSGSIPDPTNGATQFRSGTAARTLAAPNGTVNIGGNTFAKGKPPATALAAINSILPHPMPSSLANAYAEPSARPMAQVPSPPGTVLHGLLPDAAMNGIDRLNPGQVTHPPYIAPPSIDMLNNPFAAGNLNSPLAAPSIMPQARPSTARQTPAQIVANPTIPLPRPNPMVVPGNINLDKRQVYNAPDGTYRTENSISGEVDGKEVLIPTIVNGKQVSNDAAWKNYYATGENLGSFANPAAADNYAEQLHLRQAGFYAPSVSNVPQVSPPSAALTSRSVHTVPIDPMTGNPVQSPPTPSVPMISAIQQAANTEAARLALARTGQIKTVPQAGNVAMPRDVVPASVGKAYQQMGTPPAPAPSAPKPPSGNALTAINSASPWGNGIGYGYISNKDASQVPSSGPLAFGAPAGPPIYAKPAAPAYTLKQMQESNPDYVKYIEAQKADPIGTGAGSMADMQAFLNSGSGPTIAPPPQYITKTVRAPVPQAPARTPLSTLGTVNPLTQIVPGLQAGFNTTPLGHLAQLFQGQPIQGGLLGMLFNGQGGQTAPVPVPYQPKIGYNGKTTVTGNELAGSNRNGSFGALGANAVMPDSMNTRRWAGDGY